MIYSFSTGWFPKCTHSSTYTLLSLGNVMKTYSLAPKYLVQKGFLLLLLLIDTSLFSRNQSDIKATIFLFVGLHFILRNFEVRSSRKKLNLVPKDYNCSFFHKSNFLFPISNVISETQCDLMSNNYKNKNWTWPQKIPTGHSLFNGTMVH